MIYNPTAGKFQRRGTQLVAQLVQAIAESGATVIELPTRRPGDATELARQATVTDADLLVVAAGDGTVNEVVNGVAGSHLPVAVLPMGTANVLATELGLPRDPIRAARLIPELQPERVSLGLLHAAPQISRYFLLMAGIGLDAYVVVKVDLEWKRRLGKLAYWLGGFQQLGRRFPEFEVHVDDEVWRSSFALASRVRNYGGDLEIAKTACLLDDCFELVAFEGEDSFRYLIYLTGVLANLLDKIEGVRIRKVEQVEFRAPKGLDVLVQVDGEVAGQLPARVELVRDAMTLLMPASYRRRFGGHLLARG